MGRTCRPTGQPSVPKRVWRSVSEIWDSREQMQAFGERMMPILADVGIEFSGQPEIFEVHKIIKR